MPHIEQGRLRTLADLSGLVGVAVLTSGWLLAGSPLPASWSIAGGTTSWPLLSDAGPAEDIDGAGAADPPEDSRGLPASIDPGGDGEAPSRLTPAPSPAQPSHRRPLDLAPKQGPPSR
ncbi:MAG: hypothetical protein ABIK09_18915 [Pseudomonadota bacterium]